MSGRGYPRGNSPQNRGRGRGRGGNGRGGGDRGGFRGNGRGNWRGRGGIGHVDVDGSTGRGRGGGGRGRGRGNGNTAVKKTNDWHNATFDYSSIQVEPQEGEIEVDWNDLGNVDIGFSKLDPLLLLSEGLGPANQSNTPVSGSRKRGNRTNSHIQQRPYPIPTSVATSSSRDLHPFRAGLGISAISSSRGGISSKVFGKSNSRFRMSIAFVPATELTTNAMKRLQSRKPEEVRDKIIHGVEQIFEEMEKKVEIASDNGEGEELSIDQTKTLTQPDALEIIEENLENDKVTEEALEELSVPNKEVFESQKDDDYWRDDGVGRMGIGMMGRGELLEQERTEDTSDLHSSDDLADEFQSANESIRVSKDEDLFYLDPNPTVHTDMTAISSTQDMNMDIEENDEGEEDEIVYVPPSHFSEVSSKIQLSSTEVPAITISRPITPPPVSRPKIVEFEDDISKFLEVPGQVVMITDDSTKAKSKKAIKREKRAERKEKKKEKNRRRKERKRGDHTKEKGDGESKKKKKKGYNLAPRMDDSDLDWGSNGPPSEPSEAEGVTGSSRRRKLSSSKGVTRDAELQDYLDNIGEGENSTGSDAEVESSMKILSRIAETLAGNQTSTYDLDVEEKFGAALETEEEDVVWQTSSESTEDEDEDEDEDDVAIFIDESAIVDVDDLVIDAGPVKHVKKKKVNVVEESTGFDEAFEALADELDMLEALQGSSKGKGKKKQRFLHLETLRTEMISQFQDDGLFQGPKRRRDGPIFLPEDVFADELQAKWEADRKKKADIKRKRAADRAAEQRLNRSHKIESQNGSFNDLRNINQQIRNWIMLEPGKETLSLPVLPKKTRAAVHLIAQAYSLSSYSKGSGKNRFPILERTPLSSVAGCDEGRIRAVIRSDESGGSLPRWRTEKQVLKRKARVYGEVKVEKSRKGERIVGESARKLGDDNIGYKLLAKMGWSEGMTMGITGGLEEPIAAKIRSKGSGLGA